MLDWDLVFLCSADCLGAIQPVDFTLCFKVYVKVKQHNQSCKAKKGS